MRIKDSCKALTCCFLIHSFISNSLFSNAQIIHSTDERYETITSNNLKIDDVLEPNNIDVEINGNTLFNIASSGTKRETAADNKFIEMRVKPNTVYTVKTTVVEGEGHGVFNYDSSKWITGYALSKNRNIFTFNSGENNIVRLHCRTLSNDNTLLNSGAVSSSWDRVIVLEGDYSNKFIPNYFEGVKSVSELENNSLKIKINNKNLFDLSKVYAENTDGINNFATYEVSGNSLFVQKVQDKGNFIGYRIKCKRGATYRYGFTKGSPINAREASIWIYSDKPWGNKITSINTLGPAVSGTFVATSDEIFMGCYLAANVPVGEVVEYKDIFLIEEESAEFAAHQNQNKEIKLSEPLRSISNGVSDKIFKKDGRWILERNCKEITIDTSNVAFYHEQIWDDYYGIRLNLQEDLGMKITQITRENHYSQDFSVYPSLWEIRIAYSENVQNIYTISANPKQYTQFFMKLPKAEIDAYTGTNNEKVKSWFRDNCPELKVVYQMDKPVYEKVSDLTASYYLGATHISDNSTIPVNFKVVVDRVANKAKEYTELAKTNPTIDNLSKARYWTNLMNESTLKDGFASQIDGITNISDLSIEKKTASANADVYIKMKNSLSLTLDTNNIVFEDFNGTESLEKQNALNLTVESSLPYKLNAYIEDTFSNTNKTSFLDISVLNVKLSTDSEYKAFKNTVDPILLIEDSIGGNVNSYSVDFKLNGISNHKADVYKTTLKFEVEQK